MRRCCDHMASSRKSVGIGVRSIHVAAEDMLPYFIPLINSPLRDAEVMPLHRVSKELIVVLEPRIQLSSLGVLSFSGDRDMPSHLMGTPFVKRLPIHRHIV